MAEREEHARHAHSPVDHANVESGSRLGRCQRFACISSRPYIEGYNAVAAALHPAKVNVARRQRTQFSTLGSQLLSLERASSAACESAVAAEPAQSPAAQCPPPTAGRYGRNVLASLVFVGLLAAMAFVNSVVIARQIGTEGRGLYSVLVAVLAIAVPIASLGQGVFSTYALGQGESERDVQVLNHLVLLFWTLVGGAGLAATFWLIRGGPSSQTMMIVAAVAASLPAAVAVELARGVYLGRQRAVAYNLVQAAVMALLIGLNLLTLRFGRPWVLVNYALGSWLVTIALAVVQLRRANRRSASAPPKTGRGGSDAPLAPGIAQLQVFHGSSPDLLARSSQLRRLSAPWALPAWSFVRRALRYGAAGAARALTDAALLRLDYLLMVPFVAVSFIGIYAIADQITHILGWGGLVAARMMFAQSANDTDGGAGSRRRLGIAIRLLIPSLFLAGGFAALVSWWLIGPIFGAAFAPAAVGVAILLPSSAFKSVSGLLSTYLAGQGQQRAAIVAGVTAVLVDVVLVLALARGYGWHAVAAAKVVACAVQATLLARAYGNSLPAGEKLSWVLSLADLRFLRDWAQRQLRSRRGG